MTLSKGNQQKIQLAAALITDPDIVILDEPFSGLDPVNAMLLEEIVRERIDKGNVVLFSSHQMNYIEEFCDNIAILNGGQIALSGGIREIKRGYDRSVILIDTQHPEQIEALCRTIPEIVTGTEASGNVVRVQMTSGSCKAELLRAVGDAQVDIDDFRVYEPSLNDILSGIRRAAYEKGFVVFKYEFINLLKNKVFLAITIVLVVLISALLCAPRIAEAFAASSSGGEDDTPGSSTVETERDLMALYVPSGCPEMR